MGEEYYTVAAGPYSFLVKAGLFYSEEGVWAAWHAKRNVVRVGLTDYRQQASRAIIFVELPERGMVLAPGDELANIESVKIDLSIATPVAGVVWGLNDALRAQPELINQDPYGAGWLLEIRPEQWPPAERLLDDQAYLAVMRIVADEVAP